ncbi:hypothetical protein [Tolumonas lignilytica]|uniref:hypothetical protein n=1 Tax=Tolumonas lignilytica TaxID=1283284 RepID=UPI0004645A80|nr:hypothetical protein [Tolumonas lignilytica]
MNENAMSIIDKQDILLRLNAQRALLGNIPASLRCVSVEYNSTEIMCSFVFDGIPSADDKELLSHAATEIIADYPDVYTINEVYLSIPYPKNMPYLRNIVFMRYEK